LQARRPRAKNRRSTGQSGAMKPPGRPEADFRRTQPAATRMSPTETHPPQPPSPPEPASAATRGPAATGAWLAGSGLLMALIFASDLVTPLGFAHGILYVLAILAAAQARRPRAVRVVCAGSAVLILLGLALSPPSPEGISALHVWGNRVLSIGAVA